MGKIMMIESTEFLGIKMIKTLEEGGFRQVEKNTGHRINGDNSHYFFADVVLAIIDLENQHIDPLALIVSLKNNPKTSKIPIIAIGSDSQWSTLKKAISAGVRDFIVKPFSGQILVSKVEKWLHNEQEQAVAITQYEGDASEINSVVGIQWNDEFAIGVEAIDKDHKAIFDKYQALYGFMKQGLGHQYYEELAEFLTGYVDAHFSREEKYQAAINYKDCEAHKAYHKKFIDELKGMLAAKKDQEISNLDLIRMNMFIKDWLLHHIFIEDRKYLITNSDKA